MKQLLLPVLLFCAVISTGWSYSPEPGSQVQGDWTLIYFRLAGHDSTAVFSGKVPFIRFDMSSLQSSGSTGCNRFSGPFIAVKDELRFDFEKMALTRMACSGDGERIFLDGLKKVTHYKIADHTLLMLAGNTLIMRWQKNN